MPCPRLFVYNMSIDGLVAHQAPSLSHQSQSYTYEHPFGLASPRDRRVRENIGSRAVEGVVRLRGRGEKKVARGFRTHELNGTMDTA